MEDSNNFNQDAKEFRDLKSLQYYKHLEPIKMPGSNEQSPLIYIILLGISISAIGLLCMFVMAFGM